MTDQVPTTSTKPPPKVAASRPRPTSVGAGKRTSQSARSPRGERASTAAPAVVIEPADDEVLPWNQRLLRWILGAEAASLGISLIVHLLLLAAMGVTYLAVDSMVNKNEITTVFADAEEQVEIDFNNLTQLTDPDAGSDKDLVIPQQVLASKIATEPRQLQSDDLRMITAADKKGEGDASGSSGFRLLEPGNAVKQGSFSVWTIPIAGRGYAAAKAGDDPAPGQDYHIVIQIKFPEKRGSYKLTDLVGDVVDSNGWSLNIHEAAFAYDENGDLRKVTTRGRIRVIDDVVQILVRVPGAQALVKDTIKVRSRSLREEQTLNLVFKGESRFRRLP